MGEFGLESEVSYAALIGDVVGSRRSPDRRALQRRLRYGIEKVNTDLGGWLSSPLALYGGDEVQGLVARPEACVEIVVGLSEAIFPECLVFGLGYGTVSTELSPDVAEIDGPCFHRARSALEDVRGEAWLKASGFGATTDMALTTLFGLMAAIRSRWTEKQQIYVRAARHKSQKSVAEELGVFPSTVSESLRASSFAAVREGEQAARVLLTQFGPEDESAVDSGEQPK